MGPTLGLRQINPSNDSKSAQGRWLEYATRNDSHWFRILNVGGLTC